MISVPLSQLDLRCVCAFALMPSRQLGAGWERVLFPAGLKVDDLSARAHFFLSRFIAHRLHFPALPSEIEDRLPWDIALLAPDRLEQFRCRLGAVLAAQEARYAIARGQADAYRYALGDDLYWFVIQCTPLLGPATAVKPPPCGPSRIMRTVRDAGLLALREICNVHCGALWPRIELKLPHEAQAEPFPPHLVLPDTGSLRRMAERILRERAP